jgi:hypothetical protein
MVLINTQLSSHISDFVSANGGKMVMYGHQKYRRFAYRSNDTRPVQ